MRLITRADLDGLACSVLITTYEPIEETLLIHPQNITNREVEVTGQDILANVPFHPNCAKWFDHHLLTRTNREPPKNFDGAFGYAPSAAELVWKYYGQAPRFQELIAETNRFDSARLKVQDILDPKGFILLGFTLDSRTGFGPFRDYFLKCNDWLKTMPIEQVLELPEVVERIEGLRENDASFRRSLTAHSHLDGNVVITDFRSLENPPIGNRFLVYVLFPQANVSLRIQWGPGREFIVAAVAHSIFNRTCKTNVGVLMSQYGGGGHVGAGSTPIAADETEEKLAEILNALKTSG